MNEENPYHPPTELPQDRNHSAAIKLEKILSKRLLEAHEHGLTIGLYYRWTTKLQVFRMLYFGIFLYLLASTERPVPFALIGGLLLGILLQEFGRARAEAKVWPVYSQFLDWDKVQEAADRELSV